MCPRHTGRYKNQPNQILKNVHIFCSINHFCQQKLWSHRWHPKPKTPASCMLCACMSGPKLCKTECEYHMVSKYKYWPSQHDSLNSSKLHRNLIHSIVFCGFDMMLYSHLQLTQVLLEWEKRQNNGFVLWLSLIKLSRKNTNVVFVRKLLHLNSCSK